MFCFSIVLFVVLFDRILVWIYIFLYIQFSSLLLSRYILYGLRYVF